MKLNSVDVHRILARTPKDVRNQLIKRPGLFLAGGFIRAIIACEKPSDIDLLGPSKGEMEIAALELSQKRKCRKYDTDNAFTVLSGKTPVQYIHRWTYTDPAKLLLEFDYTIAQAVIWFDGDGEKWESLCSDSYYMDLAAKRLVYTYPHRDEDVGGSLLRAFKFCKRGYSIDLPSMAGVVTRLTSGVKEEDQNGLAETVRKENPGDHPEIIMEKTRARALLGLLFEVDPLLVIEGTELSDEHEKFTIG